MLLTHLAVREGCLSLLLSNGLAPILIQWLCEPSSDEKLREYLMRVIGRSARLNQWKAQLLDVVQTVIKIASECEDIPSDGFVGNAFYFLSFMAQVSHYIIANLVGNNSMEMCTLLGWSRSSEDGGHGAGGCYCSCVDCFTCFKCIAECVCVGDSFGE